MTGPLLRLALLAVVGLCLLSPHPLHAAESSRGPRDVELELHPDLLSPELVCEPHQGSVRLMASVLVADETGATDSRQTETLTEHMLAKKVFQLDSPDVTRAEVLIYGGAAHADVNGTPLKPSRLLASTGWSQFEVPPAALKSGANEVTLSGPGSLLIEPGTRARRSFKSVDRGRTWSNRALGKNDNQQGEYLVRLRLGRYAEHGRAMTPVFDLWRADPAYSVPMPAKLLQFSKPDVLGRKQPEGTRLVASLRTGGTPQPEAQTWSDWIAFDKDYQPPELTGRHRWAQLRFDLISRRPQATPLLPAVFKVRCRTEDSLEIGPSSYQGLSPEPPRWVGSTPFVYQEPSPRLKLLRERYRLDQVIAPGKTEMEQLMLLRHWVRNQWHTAWGSHPAAWMPPWDALVILESKEQPDCLTMCTHYAAVFTQCCLALGWNARHCILDHHCVAEVWVDQHQKWVMMDAGNSAERADVTLHFERAGVPLGALELHLAQRSGKFDGVTACFTPAALMGKIEPLCRPAPPAKKKWPPRPDRVSAAEVAAYPVCGLENYRRYAFPGRNNYLQSLLPGELYQGWSHYFYDGYWWVGDSRDAPQSSPEYSRHLPPDRPQDIDWSLNWTRIHLCRTKNPAEVQVDLETHTPNLLRLEKQSAKDGWQATGKRFLWKLQPGNNVLAVRSVNHWERAGRETTVQVRWEPAP